MIDIHSHILPGLDDGPGCMEDALEMLRLAAQHGPTEIVATPHADTRFRFEPVEVERRLMELRVASGADLRIHYGCEMHFTPENIECALRTPARYTIGHKGYLLVEFRNLLVPKSSAQILARLMAAGMRPIVAHPERNPILRQRMRELENWVTDGCLLQVTAQSLVGQFGRSAEEAGLDMVAGGLAHCVATDAHDVKRRAPVLDDACRLVEDMAGTETACRLFETNPRAILQGGPIVTGTKKKTWYAIW